MNFCEYCDSSIDHDEFVWVNGYSFCNVDCFVRWAQEQ